MISVTVLRQSNRTAQEKTEKIHIHFQDSNVISMEYGSNPAVLCRSMNLTLSFVAYTHLWITNKMHQLHTSSTTLNQSSIQLPSLVCAMSLRINDQCNKNDQNDDNHDTYNHKCHYPSPTTLSPTYRPQAQNVVFPNALIGCMISIGRKRLLSVYIVFIPSQLLI